MPEYFVGKTQSGLVGLPIEINDRFNKPPSWWVDVEQISANSSKEAADKYMSMKGYVPRD